MADALAPLQDEALHHIANAVDLKALDDLRIHYLGKKGALTEALKSVGTLPHEARKAMGQAVNEVKAVLEQHFAERKAALTTAALQAQLAREQIDVSLPGSRAQVGALHPVSLTRQAMEDFFIRAGFVCAEGPEIEDEYHNFEALNISATHPARTSQDTFYFPDGKLLRTHTSGVQNRFMKQHQPPFKMITTGRVYRCYSDQTHTPMFHQLEGLWVDKTITFAHLKGVLSLFLEDFFNDEALKIRFRPAYFPFTEPSAEVDIWFNDRWLEVLGCGMVHPEVLKQGGIDPEVYQGFAFGLGIDRFAMIRYGISDLRALFENDVRLLRQF